MARKYPYKGFTLIELLVVMMIISALAMISVPGFVGTVKQARMASIVTSCSAFDTELLRWMLAVNGAKIRVDFDGDGFVSAADENAKPLDLSGIPGQWDKIHRKGTVGEAISPYRKTRVLFNASATAGDGQIAIHCSSEKCTMKGYSDKTSEGEICLSEYTL